jgi:ABC-type sugar transport system ATPase subunit
MAELEMSASSTADTTSSNDPGQRDVVLVADRVSKAFPGVLALDDVSFEVRAGEVNALVGENGAGKSTLIKLMAGFYAPDSGEIRILGRPLSADPAAAHEAGIATIHQDHQLIPSMTVAENLLLGRWPTRLGVISRASMMRQAEEALDQVAPDLPPRKLARQLSPAESQLVEIARALAENSRVLIMDEPTTSLSGREVDALFATVERLRARGLAIVFVSHWLEEVFAIADRVTVLRDGRLVGSRPASELDHPAVIRMMVGRNVQEVTTQSVAPGRIVLEVEGLTRSGAIDNISFQVRAGEIVTLAGLVGAGRSEVVNAIFGADRYEAGAVSIDGVALPSGDPTASMEAGVGYVPEDRRQQALIGKLSVRSNATLAMLREVSPGGLIRRDLEDRIMDEAVRSLSVRMASPDVPIATLSGGNQQKIVIARWLARDPKLLILDEPTKGVDVGAKAEISEIIVRLAAEGRAILLVSSELPEVLALSDRVLVMRMGRIAGELDRASLNAERVMTLATTG